MVSLKTDKIRLTKLSRFKTNGGDVLHAIKESSDGFDGFGEAYFSWIEPKYIKAWKCHKRMTMNLVVPIGEVRFVFLDDENNSYREEIIGEKNYARLTVPSNVWFGFQGLGSSSSLVLNLASIEHDPQEVIRSELSHFDFNWSK